jgi:hypothetical protein
LNPFRHYFFSECQFSPLLRLGFLEIKGADRIPATESMVRIWPDEAFILFPPAP